jgi:uncharacterized protein with FMN-binding domain
MEETKKSSAFMWAVVVVIIALLAYGGYAYLKKEPSNTTEDTTNSVSTVPTGQDNGNVGPSDTVNGTTYKDGTYTALGDYTSPGGAEQIKVTVTLKDDIITDATVVSLATRPETKLNQNKFISGFKAQVIGKKITDVVLSKVSGSSLTPGGWNNAISKIEAQAQV